MKACQDVVDAEQKALDDKNKRRQEAQAWMEKKQNTIKKLKKFDSKRTPMSELVGQLSLKASPRASPRGTEREAEAGRVLLNVWLEGGREGRRAKRVRRVVGLTARLHSPWRTSRAESRATG